jgi:hypothetical protein
MVWATAYLLALAANPAPALVMVDKPVTVSVHVPESARHSEVLLLKLEGVIMRRNAPAVWNIFWEMPDANAQTPVTSEHFAGSVSSPANSAIREPKAGNFIVELPPVAARVGHRLGTIRLTFVPVRKLPEGGVTITTLRLE